MYSRVGKKSDKIPTYNLNMLPRCVLSEKLNTIFKYTHVQCIGESNHI